MQIFLPRRAEVTWIAVRPQGGTSVYDTTHYLTHHSAGKTALGRYQKKRHFRHHYYDSTRNFGVSSPLWDVIWGPMGRTGR